VVHIPARSGSTRLPDKCIHKLAGLPLLAYSILVALNTPGVDRVIVNTDSEKYAEIARSYGAETPFIRPAELAQLSTPAYTTPYVMGWLAKEKYPWKNLITLYPTSPFRNVHTIKDILQKLQTFAAVNACCPTAFNPNNYYVQDEKKILPLFRKSDLNILPSKTFKPMGNFLASNRSKRKSFCYKLIHNPVELIDIDTLEDISMAEEVMQNLGFEFGLALPREFTGLR
jgi:CMP-N-acetylneuraminic acid synthetase